MECRAVKDRTHFVALMAIAYHVSGDAGRCTASTETLQSEARLSERAFQGAVNALTDGTGPKGYGVPVVFLVSGGGGHGRTAVYRLNLPWLRGEMAPPADSDTPQALRGKEVENPAAAAPFEDGYPAGAAGFGDETPQALRQNPAGAAGEPVIEPVGEGEDDDGRDHGPVSRPLWRGEATGADSSDLDALGPDAARHRVAVDAALVLDDDGRRQWACRVLRAGNLPPAESLRDLGEREARHGPLALVAGLAIVDHADLQSPAYASRLRYLDKTLSGLSDHARRHATAPDLAADPGAHPGGDRGPGGPLRSSRATPGTAGFGAAAAQRRDGRGARGVGGRPQRGAHGGTDFDA
ncbi:MAG TPA: hypothetical protein VGB53_05655 [Rubricoccaceae bacterium]